MGPKSENKGDTRGHSAKNVCTTTGFPSFSLLLLYTVIGSTKDATKRC